MNVIIACESGYQTDIQSKHRYKKDRPHEGVLKGQREKSWGLVQIHLPAHPSVSKEQANTPEFAVDFLARNIEAGNIGWWSCYHDNIAML